MWAGDKVIRLLLVDDEHLVRAALRMVLDSADDLTVVAEVADGAEVVPAVLRHAPDIVVMDIQLPGVDGLAATRAVSSLVDAPKVLMLTMFDLDANVYAAIEAGAAGFLLKDARPEELINAVRVVAQGEAMLSPSVTRRVLDRFSRDSGSNTCAALRRIERLTPRETEILKLLGGGLSNSAIAVHLELTESTVKSHVSRLLVQLGCGNRVQAAILAHYAGIACALVIED